jgi:putative transposase
MSKKKKHSRAEIASKLARANDLATQGKLQSEIARALGVSVMTLHRWRKAPHGSPSALGATQQTNRGSLSALGTTHAAGQTDGARGADRIAELQLENSRLRRLVTDLLLEKIKLEEGA